MYSEMTLKTLPEVQLTKNLMYNDVISMNEQ